MITAIVIYLILGALFTSCITLQGDKRAFTDPPVAVALVLLWWIFIAYYACSAQTLSYKGKVVWRRGQGWVK